MNAAKNQQPIQLEIGENTAATAKKESGVQLEIAGIVDKYATAAADVQKGTVGKIGQLTRTMAFAGALAVAPSAGMAESPYLPFAANEGGVVLVEKERVKLEKEFVPLLEANGKTKYLEQYAMLEPKAKDKIASGYRILKTKSLEDKKTAAAVAALIESGLGVQNAKTIIREWTKNRKDANLETYTVAQKIKAVAKLAPEILELYDIAELEEIDRLQVEVVQAQAAANRQEAAASEQRAAASEQRAARLKEENAKLDAMLKRL